MPISLDTFAPQKILLCQQRQIGDVAVFTSSISLVAQKFPDAELHVLTEQKCAPVLENNPLVRKVHLIRPDKGLRSALKLYMDIRAERYDLVIAFQLLPRIRMAAFFSRAPVRIGVAKASVSNWPFTHLSSTPKGGYAGRCKAGVLAPLGIEWNHELPRMYISPAEQAWADQHLRALGLRDGETLVSVGATHRSRTRRWFSERYAETISLMARQRPGLKFYLLYGPGERETVEKILAKTEIPEQCLLAPEEDLPSLRKHAAIIARAALHIGNCSAPRHFAVALDTPSLTIIGANGETAWTFPSEQHQYLHKVVPCRKCNTSPCPNGTLRCLKEVTAKDAADRALEMLTAFAPE
ncbi:MAG: glycosyltransferase family 9 protein [Desulfovibrio sp.]